MKLPPKSTMKVPISAPTQGKKKTPQPPQQKHKYKQTKDDESKGEIATYLGGGELLTRHFEFGHNATSSKDGE